MASSWIEFTLEVSAAAEEDLAAALCGAGALGVKVDWATRSGGAVLLRTFFDASIASPALESEVTEIGAAHGARVLRATQVEDGRWVERWLASLAAFDVGRRFTIVPVVDPGRDEGGGEPRPASGPGARLAIRICPSRAFGTGEHATTRLCLEALERESLAGRSVIDVGTGSGILAIAARLLGCGRTLALDNDPEAVAVARVNSALNPGSGPIAFLCGEPASIRAGRFDVVVANLNGPILERVLPDVVARLAPGGKLILSGLLEDEADAVGGVAERLGARRVRAETQDGWACAVHSAR